MNNYCLQKGTILDGRYQIQEPLGEGGFGITYAAENRLINLKVAVKELFWREHVKRACDGSSEILILYEKEREDYEELKQKFLREARLLRDFDQEPGVVRVLDYFEANETAYLVMEYLEGMTFRQYIKEHGIFEPEDLFRRLLPLMESLAHIHRAGVIHRDISPDNIMILNDGSFKLLDFGAARNYKSAAGGQYTTIARENYAPGEQFDRNGNQGPWTDVYALCATVYEGVTGMPPESAVQRMFLDELKRPSQTGIFIDASYEKIIMKGLEMLPDDRYPDMEQMKKAVVEALPVIAEENSGKRRMITGILCGAALAGLVAGIFLYGEYDRTHKFRNIETETFCLAANEEMTAQEFADAQAEVESRLCDMAGEDNYIIEVEGDAMIVTLPLEEFEGQEISGVLEKEFVTVNEEKPFRYQYEIKADWENPENSLTAGENQCMPDEVEGISVTQIYASNSDLAIEQMTRGQWSNLLTDLKVRLDSLDTPYALGLLYGKDTSVVVKISAEKTGEWISESLGRNIMPFIRGEWDYDSISLTRNPYQEDGAKLMEVEKNPDGGYKLVCRLKDSYDVEKLQEISEYLLKNGKAEIYLDTDFDDYAAGASFTEPIKDGVLEFTDIYVQEGEEAQRTFLEYIAASFNETDLPEWLLAGDRIFQDEKGQLLFGTEAEKYFGIHIKESPVEEEFRLLTEKIKKDGWEISRTDGQTAWVQMGMSADETLIEDGFARVKEFIRQYKLTDSRGFFYLCLIPEQDERCRILLMDSGTERRMAAQLVMVGENMKPYFEEAEKAWEDFCPEWDIILEEPMLEENF